MESNVKPEYMPAASPPPPPPSPMSAMQPLPPTFSAQWPALAKEIEQLRRLQLKAAIGAWRAYAMLTCIISGILSVAWYITTLFVIQVVHLSFPGVPDGYQKASIALTSLGTVLYAGLCATAAFSIHKGYRAAYFPSTIGMPIVATLTVVGLVLGILYNGTIGVDILGKPDYYSSVFAIWAMPTILGLNVLITSCLLCSFTADEAGLREYEKYADLMFKK